MEFSSKISLLNLAFQTTKNIMSCLRLECDVDLLRPEQKKKLQPPSSVLYLNVELVYHFDVMVGENRLMRACLHSVMFV